MWAMLSLLVAISSLTFQKTNNGIRAGLGVVWSLIASLVVWCILTSWETHAQEGSAFHSTLHSVKNWLANFRRALSLQGDEVLLGGTGTGNVLSGDGFLHPEQSRRSRSIADNV